MLPRFDRGRVGSVLRTAQHHQRVAFAASCCERLMPAYALFLEGSDWGDAEPLRAGIAALWRRASGEALDEQSVRELLDRCGASAPDLDEVEAPHASEALDAASAVCAALELVLADDPHGALEVAETAINAVDLVVQESQELDAGDPLLEAKILAHPLMQQELARQERDLSELATLSQGDAARLAKHRQRAGSESALSVEGHSTSP